MALNKEGFLICFKDSFDDQMRDELPNEISFDSYLDCFNGWDSLTRLSLTVTLEEDFNIVMEQGDFIDCETVQDLFDLAKSKHDAQS